MVTNLQTEDFLVAMPHDDMEEFFGTSLLAFDPVRLRAKMGQEEYQAAGTGPTMLVGNKTYHRSMAIRTAKTTRANNKSLGFPVIERHRITTTAYIRPFDD